MYSTQVPTTLSPPTLTPESYLLIVLRKSMRSTRNPSPHYIALSYHRLSLSFYTCFFSLSFVTIPKIVREALAHPSWHKAMTNELSALHNNGTWELVTLLSGKFIVSCRWVFATIDRLKAHLVVKGDTQIFGLNFGNTFSLVAKMASVSLFIVMLALQQ